MKKEVLGNCPVCNHTLQVTELNCKKCNTTISGEFELCKFCSLEKDKKYFAEIFIKCRGNIKEIEKELKISYPTVRKLLDEVIEALGYRIQSEEPAVDKKNVLDQLSKGEISAEDAMKLLK